MSYQALNLVIQIHLLGTKAPNTPRKMRDCETSKGHHNTDNGRKHRRQSEKALSSLFVDFFYSQQKNKVIKFGDTELNKLSPYSSKCDRII